VEDRLRRPSFFLLLNLGRPYGTWCVFAT